MCIRDRIVRELTEADVDVSLRYIGWNNSGIDNKKSASVFSPVRALGGKSGFRGLYEFLTENGTDFYFDLDLMKIKKSGNGFSVYSDVCRSIFNTRTPIYEYMRSVYVPVKDKDPYYLLTPANVKAAVEKFLKKYSFGGGISLSGLGSSAYSDFKGGLGREACIDSFTEALEEVGQEHTIALELSLIHILHMLDYGTIRFEMGYASSIAVVLFTIMLLSWIVIKKLLSHFNK